jgi:hypothetical protein
MAGILSKKFINLKYFSSISKDYLYDPNIVISLSSLPIGKPKGSHHLYYTRRYKVYVIEAW